MLRCMFRESFTDRTMMVAAGLAFFGLFGLLPSIAVAGLLFQRLLGDETLAQGASDKSAIFPEQTSALLQEFLTSVPDSLTAGLGLSLNLLVVLWSVQRASSGLITALNVVYDEDERRHRMRREAVALAIAFGGLAFLFASLFLVVVLPLLASLPRQEYWQNYLPLRWPALGLLVFLSLSLLYRFAACRDRTSWPFLATAAGAATLLWLAVTYLFSLYMNNVGGWEQYYGSVTTPAVLMAWMFIAAFVVMLGAEFDAQLEQAAHPREGRQNAKQALDRRERA